MRVTRSLTAVASAALLALGGVALAATSASAAEVDPRPGAQSPSLEVNSAHKPAPQIDRIAQQFIQPEDGNLAQFTIQLWDIGYYDISDVAVHTFTPGVGPSESPIAGGIGGAITFEAEPVGDQTKIWATIDFPDRPHLTNGERYAVVIGTQGAAGENVSFGLTTPWDPEYPDFFTWKRENGEWDAVGTVNTVFTSQLVTVVDDPVDPDPETPGETPGGEQPGAESPASQAPKKPKAVETGLAA